MSAAPEADQRFPFGENWQRFIEDLDEGRIRKAELSLTTMLGIDGVRGRSFLDVGCGSGLFSLAAVRLGAASVHSFDYDPDSVTATAEVRARHAPDANWIIEQGDITDARYCEGLGTFDIVYAWGVLHHTGAMWTAMQNAAARVAEGGMFFVAIYNDQGRASKRWRIVKKFYNQLPSQTQASYAVLVMLPFELRILAGALVRRQLGSYVRGWLRGYDRGMSRWHDLLDWVGGYPFEVAKPEEVVRFCRARGLDLVELSTLGGGSGCNQFVFRRSIQP